MKCEAKGCTNKVKFKVSMDNSWTKRWCFKHTLFNMKGMMRQAVQWNRAIYIQRDAQKRSGAR